MKCYAEVGVQGRMSRLGLLSLIAMMILVVSVGKSYAADEKEFTLYHRAADGKTAGAELAHMKSADDFKTAHDLLTGKNPDYTEYAKKFADEPFKFVEGVQTILKDELKKEKGNVEELLKSISAGFEKVEASDFGDRGYEVQNGYRKLLLELSKLPKDKLKKLLEDKEFLKKLFAGNPDLLKVLLENFDLAEKKEPVKDEGPKPPKTDGPKVDDEARRRAEEEARRNDEFRRAMERQIKEIGNQVKNAVQTPPPPPVTPAQPRTGEQAEIDAKAAQFCKSVEDLRKAQDDGFAKSLAGIKDVAAKLLDQNRSTFPVAQNQGKNADKQLADVLEGLFNNKQQQQPFTQAPTPQIPQAPQQQQPSPNQNPALAQQIQPQQPEEQPALPPLNFGQSTVSAPQRDIVLQGIPNHSGRREISDSQTINAFAAKILKTDVPKPMNMFGQQTPPPLYMMQLQPLSRQTKTALAQAESQLEIVKDQRQRLEERLEQLKGDARNALPRWAKAEEQRLQDEVEKAKKAFEERKGLAQQAAQDPRLRDQVQAQILQERQELSQKEEALNKHRQKMDAAAEEGNQDLALLKSNVDKLSKEEKTLSSTVSQLQDRSQEIDTNLQQSMASMMQPQQQPQQNWNVGNRAQQMGPRQSSMTSTVGRAMQPQRSGAQAAQGPVQRGALGGALGSMSAQ